MVLKTEYTKKEKKKLGRPAKSDTMENFGDDEWRRSTRMWKWWETLLEATWRLVISCLQSREMDQEKLPLNSSN